LFCSVSLCLSGTAYVILSTGRWPVIGNDVFAVLIGPAFGPTRHGCIHSDTLDPIAL